MFTAKAWLEATGPLRRPSAGGRTSILAQCRRDLTISAMMPARPHPSVAFCCDTSAVPPSAAGIVSLATATTAEAGGLIRDAETKSLIRDYAKPIFDAAGLGAQGVNIHLINDRAFNAFVVDGHNMFIHAGALMDCKDTQSDHRRDRARKRPYHRRPSGAPPQSDLARAVDGADDADHRHSRHGGGRLRRPGHARASRHGRGLWRHRRRHAHGARLPAERGVVRRSGRRDFPQRDQAVGRAGCSRPWSS